MPGDWDRSSSRAATPEAAAIPRGTAQPLRADWLGTPAALFLRAGLVMAVVLAVADLAGVPFARSAVWIAGVLTAAAASVLALVASEHAAVADPPRWQGQALAATMLMLALMARGQSATPLEPAASLTLLCLAVATTATAAMRLAGPVRIARAVRLLLDAAVLAEAVTIAIAVLFDRAGAVSPSLLLVPAYAATAYAVAVATRRSALAEKRGPDSLLLLGVLATCVYATGHAGVPLAAAERLAAPSIGFLAALALLASAWQGLRRPAIATSSEASGGSRLRLIPAASAGLALALLTLSELSGATRAGFVGAVSLLALIVMRLLFALFENRQLLRTVERSGLFEEKLRDLGAALLAAFDRKEALEMVCRTAQVAFSADSVVLWMVDPTTDEIEAVEALGPKRQLLLGRRMPLSDPSSLAARVARTGEAEVVQPVVGAERTNGFLSVLLHAQSLMAVPIARGQAAQGVLVCVDARNAAAYGTQELAKGELLASQVAVALDNAYQHALQRRRLEEVTALYQFAQSAHAAHSASEVARQMLPILKERLRYTYAAVWVRDPATATLRLAAGDSPGGAPLAGLRPSTLATQALGSGEPARAGLGWDIPVGDYVPPRSGIKSQLAVPMVLKRRVVGVVDLESRQPNAYSLNDERLLVSVTNHAALAIENINLLDEARKVEALKELDHMKSELLSTVSHELRTPLGSIKGYATTLLTHEHKLRREERREFLEIIDSEADRLRELIENLLDLSRIEAGVLRIERAVTRLGPVAEDLARKVQLASPDHRVIVEWPQDREVYVDSRRIYQVLQNLLSNAVKYSPHGGQLAVRGQFTARELLVSVADEGLGMPSRELDRIFDRFHRVGGEVSRQIGGTGLGLAICKALVEAHGGRIWAESEGEGRGSTFRFTLPLVQVPTHLQRRGQ